RASERERTSIASLRSIQINKTGRIALNPFQQVAHALRRSSVTAFASIAAIAMLGNADAAAAPKPKIDTPRISCAGATQTSINIQVCGGATTGLPAGFSLQWAKLPDFQANNGQWSDGSDL